LAGEGVKTETHPYHVYTALLHNSQAVDNKNEFLWHFYNNFRLSQGQLKTYATTPVYTALRSICRKYLRKAASPRGV
jgi:hypothetical protein